MIGTGSFLYPEPTLNNDSAENLIKSVMDPIVNKTEAPKAFDLVANV
jgi:hypothetical protein